MYTLKVRKPGNSLGVILPKERQHRLAVQAGDELFALDAPDGVTLTPYDPELRARLRRLRRALPGVPGKLPPAGQMMPAWLSAKLAQAMHAGLLLRDGGARGPVSADCLDSTLASTRRRLACGSAPDLLDLAASYGYGLARNNCFSDGNKRIALACIGVFMRINGLRLTASPHETCVMSRDLATGAIGEAQLAACLRGHAKALQTAVPASGARPDCGCTPLRPPL